MAPFEIVDGSHPPICAPPTAASSNAYVLRMINPDQIGKDVSCPSWRSTSA